MQYGSQYGQTPLGGLSGASSALIQDKTQDGLSRITKSGVLKTQTGKSKILIPGVGAQAISGKARITAHLTSTQEGQAAIQLQQNRERLGLSRIKVTFGKTQTGVANINANVSETQIGKSRIARNVIQDINIFGGWLLW